MSLKRTPTSPRRPVVYVALPYAADTDKAVQENVRRAEDLGRLLATRGFAPLVPHSLGFAGLYGSPTEADDGTSRRVALECSEALAGRCDAILLTGPPSEGMSLEKQAFIMEHPECRYFDTGTGRQLLVDTIDALLMARMVVVFHELFGELTEIRGVY